MLARWALPTLRCQARLMRVKRAYYHTESFEIGEGHSRVDIYSDNGKFRFNMDIYNHGARDNDSPLILYLPALSFEMAQYQQNDPGQINEVPLSIPDYLLHAFRVVRINYRWSPAYPFPGPLHDVIFGYDAIVQSWCSAKTKVGVYGRSLGGTLATSLALTESDPAKPGYISTLAIHEAPLDFATLATETLSPENYPYICRIKDDEERTHACQSILRIQKLTREFLFTNPSACFDPFASPLLFFRNAGREVPDDFAPFSEIPPPLKHISAYPDLQSNRSQGVRTPPVRFPAKGSSLIIPKSFIQTEHTGWEDHQGRELAKLMKRSVFMYEMKEKRDRDFDAEEEAENRIQYVHDPKPAVMTEGFQEASRAKENKMIEWLEDAMHN